jgi:hypothetical protein
MVGYCKGAVEPITVSRKSGFKTARVLKRQVAPHSIDRHRIAHENTPKAFIIDNRLPPPHSPQFQINVPQVVLNVGGWD